jgi:hypothetical protein
MLQVVAGEHDVVARDDLAAAKGEIARGVRASGDDPASIDVEAAVEDVPTVLVPYQVVDHAWKEQRVEAAILVGIEDEARDRFLAQSSEERRRWEPRVRR